MRRRVTATRVMLIVPLWLLAGPDGKAEATKPGAVRASVPLLGHVTHNAPAAVGLFPDDVRPPAPAGCPTHGPPAGQSAAGPVAVGLVASFGLLLRRLSVRSRLPQPKPAPPAMGKKPPVGRRPPARSPT